MKNLQHDLVSAEIELNRVNKHSISGPVLSLLRTMKNDPNFGLITKNKMENN